MRLQLIREDKFDFDYSHESKTMWDEKVKEAKEKANIHFDLENNDTTGQKRKIAIPETGHGAYETARFKCELYSAGGDWESPVRYFRCEIYDGYVDGLSQYSNPHFCFIPGKNEGNGHLVKGKSGGYTAPDSNTQSKKEWKQLVNDRKCWEALKKYLKTLVKKGYHK